VELSVFRDVGIVYLVCSQRRLSRCTRIICFRYTDPGIICKDLFAIYGAPPSDTGRAK
jgi:hypothetical protein